MSVYHKPQTPIKSGEKYIYPLTTADQVLVEDGSRLNAKYITVDINDAEMGTVPITNANQLGGLDASQYATKEHVASEYITKEYVDNLLDGTVINLVERYGVDPVYANKNDCTALINQAIQDATAEDKHTSADTLYLPPGKYYTTGTIIVNKSVNLKFDGSIEYQGTGYAIEFSNYNYCKAEINRIRTSTGSCIKLSSDSTAGNGHIVYSTFKFNRLSAKAKADGNDGYCIYAETKGTGYIGQNKFIGGQCASGYTAFKANNIDNYEYAFGGNLFETIAIEGGFNTGFHFTNYCANNMLLHCNLEESGDGYLYGVLTEGTVSGLKIINSSNFYRSYMNLSEQTDGMVIGSMRDSNGQLIDSFARIVRGDFVLESHDRTKSLLDHTGEYDMATAVVEYEDTEYRTGYSEIGLLQYNNEYNHFIVGGNCTGIRLSKKYGDVNGINEFFVTFEKENIGTFPIKDFEGNEIAYVVPQIAGITVRFNWTFQAFPTGRISSWEPHYEFSNLEQMSEALKLSSFVQKAGDVMTGELEVPALTSTGNIETSTLSLDGTEIKNLLFPIGTIYTTSTNVNPASTLGGSWTLIDKFLKYGKYDLSEDNGNLAFNINEESVSSASGWIIIDGDTIQFHISVKLSKALADTTVELCHLSLYTHGINLMNSSTTTKRYFIGSSDGGNGLCQIYADGPVLSSIDVVTKASGGSIASGSTIILDDVWKIEKNQRLNDHCDRFLWKRTA